MSIKVQFLYSHLDKFPNDCSDVSNEQGELFNWEYQNTGRTLHGTLG